MVTARIIDRALQDIFKLIREDGSRRVYGKTVPGWKKALHRLLTLES